MSEAAFGPDPAVARLMATDQRARRIRWGFLWAVWSAALAGAWYIPGTALWYEPPFSLFREQSASEVLVAASLLSTLGAVIAFLAAVGWALAVGKLSDSVALMRRSPPATFGYAAAAWVGGPLALLGGYLAMAYIGAVFAAAAALLHPLVGAALARLWYRQRMSHRGVAGLAVIVVAGLVIFGPGLYSELSAAGTEAWPGYVGGLMTALGWGLEGAIVGRAQDFSDSDAGLVIRFATEALYWLILVIPALLLWTQAPVMSILLEALSHPATFVLLTLAGMTFSFGQATWYKSFPLLGVGRAQAVGDLFAVFTVVFTVAFTLQWPEPLTLLGIVLAIAGGFVLFTEDEPLHELLDALRRRG